MAPEHTDPTASPAGSAAPWILRCADEDQTRALGRALGQVAPPGLVVALVGDLGAGKTCLAQGAGEGLGVAGPVVSPTFVLVAEHDGPRPLLHADLYRLQVGELAAIGLEEALEGWPGLALVEWADRFPEVLPPDHLRVCLHLESGGRRVEVTAHGPRAAQALTSWRRAAAPPGHEGPA